MRYTPDSWVIVEIKTKDETLHKVFGTWFGGYLNGDSWRLNSGIDTVSKTADGGYAVDGYSGSIYFISPGNYGTTEYTEGVLAGFEAQKGDAQIKGLTREESLRFLDERSA